MNNTLFWAVPVLALLLNCSKPQVNNPTDDFGAAQRISELKNRKLSEISGIAASISNPGLFWVHNDSGNEPEVYLIDQNLSIRMTCRIGRVENRDWEDIAVGPGPEDGKIYVFVGEIGDNKSKYPYKHIYRFEEPTLRDGASITIDAFDTITFKLEGKKKDTETLLVHPKTRDLYVISKREEPVWVYELKYPHVAQDTLIAKKILSLPFTQIVGGDISSDGKRVLLKNYEHVYYWKSDEDLAFANLISKEYYEVPYEIEPQGEALAWAFDNSGFYTISEMNVGKTSYLYFYEATVSKSQPRNEK